MSEKDIGTTNDNSTYIKDIGDNRDVEDSEDKADKVENADIVDNTYIVKNADIAAANEGGQPVENSIDNEVPQMVENQSKDLKFKTLVKVFAIFLALTLLLSLTAAGINIGKAIIKNQTALKIVAVHENMESTINQNDEFNLPDNIAVKMGDGRSKAVNVAWDKPAKVDSSRLGTQVYKCKIEGYKKTINYTINVLPKTASNKFSDVKTYNSQVDYDIDFNAAARSNIKFIRFKIKKDGDTSYQYLTVVNGYLKGAIYFTFGPGTYTVSASITTKNDRYSEYVLEKEYIIENDDKRQLRYLNPTLDVECSSMEIINMAREITKGCYSDMEKTRAIHDWVATHIAYDIERLNKGDLHDYSALETLQGRKAICNGYANLTAALNRAVGIKTRIMVGWFRDSVEGKEVREDTHGWNETYIDDRWVIQDTTWDAGYIVNKEKFKFRLSHKYFDADLFDFAKDHVEAGVRE